MRNRPSQNWKSVPLRDLTSKIGSGATPRGGEKVYKRRGIPLIRSMNIHFAGFRAKGLVYLDNEQAAALDGVTVLAGDILLNITGASIGRVTQAPEEMSGARVNQHVCIIRPTSEIEPSFLARYLASPEIQTFIAGENYGVTRQALTKGIIENIGIPVPPLHEQRRIVGELDRLLEHTDAARQNLNHIPRLVGRYKQAILAAVMEIDDAGRAWPSVLLEELITEGPTNGYSPRSGENPKGTLSLKLTATTRGVMDLSDRAVKRLNEVMPADSKFWLHPGDILIQRANSLDYVGMAAIYDGPAHKYIYPDLMIRIRVESPLVARWIWRYCSSASGRRYFTSNATGTAGNMPKINGATIRKMQIPLPPLDKLEALLGRIDRALDVIDALQMEAGRAQRLLGRLEQSILAKAFRKSLSPQGLDNEPLATVFKDSRVETLEQTARTQESVRAGKRSKNMRTTKGVTMAKKRIDVSEQHLTESLRSLNGTADAKALWQLSGMDIDEFYKQLREEIRAGHIEEGATKERLRLTDAA